ncbi:hypothetical protein GH721_10735 [Kriegella sp. EG-1]|nr:hypothetical protein [Flavobacteriaceae bacterium EG-1]
MNKLVIVGNGFDLAHGLETSYIHFINSFWSSLNQEDNLELINSVITINEKYLSNFPFNSILNFRDFDFKLRKYVEDSGYDFIENQYKCINNRTSGFEIVFEFKNNFFKQINLKSLENWVDIENEYYSLLKSIAKRKSSSYSGGKEKAEKEQVKNNKLAAIRLNKEFNEVKELLKSYLINKVHSKYDFVNGRIKKFEKFLSFFEIKPLNLKDSNINEKYLNEFPREDYEDLLDFDNSIITAKGKNKLKNFLKNSIYQTLFLNFNYTDSLNSYLKIIKSKSYGDYLNTEIIPIHGSLLASGNYEINFGFGDEMDEDYKAIENLNENEYLKNFKSFKYSTNHNYKRLLDFTDSTKFQVYIIGHSCGLSDRILLNTIFEHPHCRSIKVFYHKKKDSSDNFTEIVQNISRHFNDKKLMRAKIVNKSLCEPMPQDIRFTAK